MRFKTLLGLVAIGGAVAYAQKRRGGDLSFDGIKNSLRSTFDSVRSQIDHVMNQGPSAGASNARAQHGNEETGYSSRSASTGYGSTDYRSGSADVGSSNVGSSSIGSSGIGPNGLDGGSRKY